MPLVPHPERATTEALRDGSQMPCKAPRPPPPGRPVARSPGRPFALPWHRNRRDRNRSDRPRPQSVKRRPTSTPSGSPGQGVGRRLVPKAAQLASSCDVPDVPAWVACRMTSAWMCTSSCKRGIAASVLIPSRLRWTPIRCREPSSGWRNLLGRHAETPRLSFAT